MRFVTPQFDRPAGAPGPAPFPVQGFGGLTASSHGAMHALGCAQWDNEANPVVPGHLLYLFPADWYEQIPDGFEIVTFTGKRETFLRGKTSPDRRYGVLAYGVLCPL